MNKKCIKLVKNQIVFLLICFTLSFAQELKPIQLLKPQMDGGKPLMKVLKDRKTTREFSTKKLPLLLLSNLFWAADGINRPESGGRTAPSAWNWHNIDIYAATADGVYLYDQKSNILKPVLKEDIRVKTALQPNVADAPIILIYVANYADCYSLDIKTFEKLPAPYIERLLYSTSNACFIAQNVYLYCASEGLVTGVRGSINKPPLAKIMKLRSDQDIIYVQSVGYPKKK